MREDLPTSIKFLLLPVCLLGLPFLGFMISGQPLAPLLEFPPSTSTVTHAPFSWIVFGLFGVVEVGLIASLLFLLFGGSSTSTKPLSAPPRTQFPWWGWVSLGSLFLFWFLAWTRFAWFADIQGLTFTPLWISFIMFLNALTYQRTGQCLFLNHPRFFISLFLWSAMFWWYFEYLNRFVQNWRYSGLEPMTATYYVMHSTLAFSTVLPAVFSACHLLQTFSFLSNRTYQRPLDIPQPTNLVWVLLFFSSTCLVGLAIWPNYFFSFLWIAPLLFMLGIQMRWGKSTIISALSQGRWQVITTPACAAILCGFFWEMWNVNSAAKWVYSIPFVDRFHLFEMPLLGYAGYVPFGLECVVAMDFFFRGRQCLDVMDWSNNRG